MDHGGAPVEVATTAELASALVRGEVDIQLAEGDYILERPLVLSRKVRITGSGRAGTRLIHEGPSAIIVETRGRLSLRRMTVLGTGDGEINVIRVNGGRVRLHRCRVRGGRCGIPDQEVLRLLSPSGKATIKADTTEGAAIRVEAGCARLSRCQVDDSEFGIFAHREARVHIRDTKVTRCIRVPVAAKDAREVVVERCALAASTSGLVVLGAQLVKLCDVKCSITDSWGVRVSDADMVRLERVSISGDHGATGLDLERVKLAQVEKVTCRIKAAVDMFGRPSGGAGFGATMRNVNGTMSDCSFSAPLDACSVQSSDLRLLRCTIADSFGHGLFASDGGTLRLTECILSNNWVGVVVEGGGSRRQYWGERPMVLLESCDLHSNKSRNCVGLPARWVTESGRPRSALLFPFYANPKLRRTVAWWTAILAGGAAYLAYTSGGG